jgi:hypothetical protein
MTRASNQFMAAWGLKRADREMNSAVSSARAVAMKKTNEFNLLMRLESR